MSELDVSTWKKFRIGDLFEVLLAKGDIQPKQVNDGPIPLVSAGNEANGIVAFIASGGDGESEIFDKGCITVSMFGKAFYQPFDFYGVSHGRVNILKPKNKISHEVGLFIVCSIDKQCNKKYDYATMCTRTRLVEEEIMLPATLSGAPDWAYMDSFMGEILKEEEAAAEQLAALAPESEADGHFLDVSGWKAFRIGDMFAVEPMPCKLSKGDLDNGHIPVYSSDSENYGILGYTSNDATYKITASKPFFVVFGDHTCNMSIVHVDFCVADNVKVLSPKIYISEDMLLFLLTAWKKNIKKLGYARHWSIAKDTDIFLPATPDGQPDWAWMEQYMQQQLDKTEKLAEHLNELN